MRVAFRVDASARIGTGHLKRCLSLAILLRRFGAEVAFVWRDHGLDCTYEVETAGTRSFKLPPPRNDFRADNGPAHAEWAGVSASQDAADTIEAIQQWQPDWLIVDHYSFDATWHRDIRQVIGCQLAVVDDLGDRAIDADILIDHNPAADHRSKYDASIATIGRILGGPRFALLGADYRNAPTFKVNADVRSIGIFMGGADAGNHSLLALAAARSVGFSGQIEVVTTRANPNLAALAEAIEGDREAALLMDIPSLAGFFSMHDIQIGAGGGATWERCRTGVPALVLATADNQLIVTDALRRAEAAVALDMPLREDVERCLALLLNDHPLRRTISMRARSLVDGRGCERVALSMFRELMSIRPAIDTDAQLVFDWRNDPATREMSGDQSAIEFAAHLTWFAASLAPASSRMIFVGQIGDLPVGVVRFDRVEGAAKVPVYSVSIFLDPELHGLGLGPPMLLAAERAIANGICSDIRLLAVTRPENAASQAMFRSCGYRGTTDFVKELAYGGCDNPSPRMSG